MGRIRRRIVYGARMGAKKKGIAIACLVLAMVVVVVVISLSNLRGIVTELALASATDMITITVNEVVNEKMTDGSLYYDKLVTLEKDENGNITALVTNMANINMLQAEITNAVVKRFGETDITEVTVPIGNLFGGTLFSGKGPRIKIKMLSVTNVSTEFRNEFSSAGINQTRHEIVMDVNVTLNILFAGYRSPDKVTTEVSIAETVIVGSVPGTYAHVE